jgi:hypothetical protein
VVTDNTRKPEFMNEPVDVVDKSSVVVVACGVVVAVMVAVVRG